MKKVILVTALITALGTSAFAQAGQQKFDPSLEQELVGICKALKSGSKLKLLRAVKRSRVDFQTVANGLVCDGKSAVKFAMANNADDTATYLARKAGKNMEGLLAKN